MTDPELTINAIPHPRSGTASALAAANDTYERELVAEFDTNKMKWCPGAIAWNDLPYIGGGAPGGGVVVPAIDGVADITTAGSKATYVVGWEDGLTVNLPAPGGSPSIHLLVADFGSGIDVPGWTVDGDDTDGNVSPNTTPDLTTGSVEFFLDPAPAEFDPIKWAYTASPAGAPEGDTYTPPGRYQPFLYALHDGTMNLDGVSDYLVVDPDGLTLTAGDTPAELVGAAVYRPNGVTTIDGIANDQPSVVGFTGQDTSANNGIWEQFKDEYGITGVYYVRCKIWNGSLAGTPELAASRNLQYLLSNTMFFIDGGDTFGRCAGYTLTDSTTTGLAIIGSRQLLLYDTVTGDPYRITVASGALTATAI